MATREAALAKSFRLQTAVGAAVFRRSTVAVELLLAHGADPHAGSRSVAEIAAFFGLAEMATLLASSESSSARAGN
ncbi:MAG: hypothetical protein M3P40_05055 [Actinomycetota bacterium]|nr:hypothetical protein [Actinomycetota bacterium]